MFPLVHNTGHRLTTHITNDPTGPGGILNEENARACKSTLEVSVSEAVNYLSLARGMLLVLLQGSFDLGHLAIDVEASAVKLSEILLSLFFLIPLDERIRRLREPWKDGQGYNNESPLYRDQNFETKQVCVSVLESDLA